MDRIISIIAGVLLLCGTARAEVDLEIVWQKYVYPTRISHAKWSADGRYIYCAIGNTIQKMDASNGEWLAVFDNVDGQFIYEVNKMQISKSGNYIVADNGNGAALVYDTRTEKKIKQIQQGVSCVTITTDDKYILFGSGRPETKGIVLYNLSEDKIDKVLQFDKVDGISQISMSHDGRYFVTGSVYEDWKGWHSKLTLWDAQTFEQIDVLEDIGTGSSLVEYAILKLSKDGKYLAAITWNPYETRIFDLDTKKLILKDGAYFGFDFMPDSYYFVGFRGDPIEKNIVELNSLDRKIKNYIVQDGNPESFGNKDNWKVFFGKMDSIYLMVNKTVGVEEKPKQEATFNIITENGKVILKFEQPIIAGAAQVSIYDIVGKIVFSEAIEQIPADGLLRLKAVFGTGVYICKISINGQELSQKFQIVR